uniref:Palmitoyltransferase n=1 Tax=Jaculus jaculus TaxID=51337 RepID=A0A8C5KCE9_JACJA
MIREGQRREDKKKMAAFNTKMADGPDEYESEVGCMPLLHPQELKHQSHYNHRYGEPLGQKTHIDDYSTWDIGKAQRYGTYECCRELVEAGYDENVTLLHWAAINDRIDLVKYYISKGAIVDQLGGDLNSTPLHWATRQGHLSMVVQLMKYGADPSLIDGEGCSCIHLAAQCGHTSIVDYHKNTAQHWAVLSGNTIVISLLLEAGANVNAQNIKGESPLDLAKQRKNHLQEARQAKGYGNPSFLRKLKADKEFRQKVMKELLVIWLVGFIADLNIDSWLIKGLTYGGVWATVQFLSKSFFEHSMHSALPLGIYLPTKFWMYVTWFWFWNDLNFLFIHLQFLANSVALFYNFGNSWKSDPEIIKATEEQQKKTIVELAETGSLDLSIFCSTCLICKPVRSKHCHVYNCCIAKFDHLCPWVGNHSYFMGYLFFFLFRICWMIYGSVLLMCWMYQISCLGVTTNKRMNARRYKHIKVTTTSIESPFNHGCVRNIIDFFEFRCCGLFHPVIMDWTRQYTIEYDQISGSGYQLV